MKVKCCVAHCPSKSYGPVICNVSWHKFPSDEHVCEQWIRELSNNSKTELKDVVVKHLRICSLHFKKEELKMSGTGRHYLLGNAVPTIFQSYEKV